MDNFNWETTDSGILIHLNTDLVASIVKTIKPKIKEFSVSNTSITIDFEDVQMVDSIGIGFLVAIHNSLSQKNGKLDVINISNDILDLFKSMHLNQHFSISGVEL